MYGQYLKSVKCKHGFTFKIYPKIEIKHRFFLHLPSKCEGSEVITNNMSSVESDVGGGLR